MAELFESFVTNIVQCEVFGIDIDGCVICVALDDDVGSRLVDVIVLVVETDKGTHICEIDHEL